MRIAIIVEGRTEKAFISKLRKFLSDRLKNNMPNLDAHRYDGRIPKGKDLQKRVANLLGGTRNPADAVIALTDVYTGTRDFVDATDARNKMREWVGDEPMFYPHAAQHDFEAWLLPYWDTIQRLAKHNKNAPGGQPESVNHNNPPAYRIKEIFEIGQCRHSYSKPRDGAKILQNNDLMAAISSCPELKAFINTILSLCDGIIIP